MNKNCIYLLLLLLLPALVVAQHLAEGKVTIKVTDDKQAPLQNATVMLVRAKDSGLIKTALSDNAGVAEIEGLQPGNYCIIITQAGYLKSFSSIFSLTNDQPEISLPAISMQADTRILKTVTVESKKPFIERKLDKIIVNVESSIVSSGGTVLDVLERSPGILVNQESAISLKGKQGVTVMIDGKPSPLNGPDLLNYLRSISASSISTIEIMTNPSAKYDAAGNAGIINIRFKKDQKLGLNGNTVVSYGQGQYPKPSAALNLNYRNKKWNLFGNYNHSRPKGLMDLYINRKFSNNGNVTSIFDQQTFTTFPIRNHVGKIGVDFFPDKRTIIGVVANIAESRYKPAGFTSAIITNPDGSLQSTSGTANTSKERRSNYFFNVNLKRTLDSTGKELTFDADYGRYIFSTRQQFHTDYFDASNQPSGTDGLRNDQYGTISIRSVKMDYTHPLKNNARLEAGLKSSLVTTDNDVKFFTIVNGNEVPDPSRTNHFLYKENVNAGYINYAQEFSKTDIQLGLRLEQTQANGDQVTTSDKFTRDYVYLFPSFFINQKLSAKHQLGLSYSRRIDRPGYRQLNPFKIFVDPYQYLQGDPSLKPVLTHSFELSHTYKQKFVTTLSYSRSTDVITDVFVQDDATKIAYQTPANLQTFDQFSLAFNVPLQIAKWWNSNTQVSLYYNEYRSPFQGGNLNNHYNSWDVNSSNTFPLGKGWTAELTGFYQARNAWGIFLIRSLAQVSTGIQKISKNKKLTYRLNATDVFYTNHIAVIIKYQNMDYNTNRHWDSRVATFSLTYRFGKNTVAQSRRRNSGVEDEKKRAG